MAIKGDPSSWASPALWATLDLLANFLCPLHGCLNFIVYGLTARGIEVTGCCRKEEGERGCAGGAYHALCRWRWRWLLRNRTSTDMTTFDSDDSRNTAPLVGGGSGGGSGTAPPPSNRGSPTRGQGTAEQQSSMYQAM